MTHQEGGAHQPGYANEVIQDLPRTWTCEVGREQARTEFHDSKSKEATATRSRDEPPLRLLRLLTTDASDKQNSIEVCVGVEQGEGGCLRRRGSKGECLWRS